MVPSPFFTYCGTDSEHCCIPRTKPTRPRINHCGSENELPRRVKHVDSRIRFGAVHGRKCAEQIRSSSLQKICSWFYVQTELSPTHRDMHDSHRESSSSQVRHQTSLDKTILLLDDPLHKYSVFLRAGRAALSDYYYTMLDYFWIIHYIYIVCSCEPDAQPCQTTIKQC